MTAGSTLTDLVVSKRRPDSHSSATTIRRHVSIVCAVTCGKRRRCRVLGCGQSGSRGEELSHFDRARFIAQCAAFEEGAELWVVLPAGALPTLAQLLGRAIGFVEHSTKVGAPVIGGWAGIRRASGAVPGIGGDWRHGADCLCKTGARLIVVEASHTEDAALSTLNRVRLQSRNVSSSLPRLSLNPERLLRRASEVQGRRAVPRAA